MTVSKSLFRALLLVAVAFFSQLAAATDYLVSGAPDTAFNGIYTENGTYFGAPKYERTVGGTTYSLKYDHMRMYWYLERELSPPSYYNFSHLSIAPTTGWVDSTFSEVATLRVEVAKVILTWDALELVENEANDGTITTSILITHNNFNSATFTGNDGDDFVQAGKVSVSNVPAGLTARVIRVNSLTLRLELTGTATNAANANSISNLSVSFLDSAFSSNNASVVENSSITSLNVLFRDQYTVGSNGADFATIGAAIAGVNRYDILVLDAGVFTEKNLTINKELVIKGQGADQTIIQAMATPQAETGRVFTIAAGLNEVAIRDVTVRYGNLVGGNPKGSAIYSESGLTLSGCRISENTANSDFSVYSAGIYAVDGAVSIQRCLLDNNTATRNSNGQVWGGALYVYAPDHDVLIENSTFTGNGAINSTSPSLTDMAMGGAIFYQAFATSVIRNSTLVGNTATGLGGAVYLDSASEQNLQVQNSILFGNTAVFDGSVEDLYVRPNVPGVSVSHSIIGSRTVSSSDTTVNESSADPLLQALADNGGPTFTMAIASTSPAFATGLFDSNTPSVDQRNLPRSGSMDIGAYQLQNFSQTRSLSYDPNGADSGSVAAQQCSVRTVSCSFTVASGDTLSRSNYTFIGWNTAVNGSGTSYQPNASISITTDTVLYAQWQAPFTITTIASNGTLSCSPNPAPAGSQVSCSATADAGYTFVGYSGDCSGYACVINAIDSDKTITANFRLEESGDTVEDPDGLGAGDGNGDGQRDWDQDNVVSLDSQLANTAVTFSTTAGSVFSNASNSPAPSSLPRGVRMPLGQFSFDIALQNAGASATLSFLADRKLRINNYFKRNQVTEQWDGIRDSAVVEGDKVRISFTLTDGDDYDIDRLVNSVIRDPGGPVENVLTPFVAENQRLVGRLTPLFPENLEGTLSYQISTVVSAANADASAFAVNAVTGELSFVNAPDFEQPGSAANSNVYYVEVIARGAAGGAETMPIVVTVMDDIGTHGVIDNLAGSLIDFTPGAAPVFATPESPAVDVTLGDFDSIAGGYLRIVQAAGTEDGSFALSDDVNAFVAAGAGADAFNVSGQLQASANVYVYDGFDWLEVGTVDANYDGQNGRDLVIHFNSSATALDAEVLLQTLLYGAPTPGQRDFRAVFSDGVSTAEHVGFSLNGVDTSAPVLLSTTPADGALNVQGRVIELVFDEPVKAGSGSLTVSDSGTNSHVASITNAEAVVIDGAKVTLTLDSSLAYSVNYTASFPTGLVTDLAGNAVASGSFTFRAINQYRLQYDGNGATAGTVPADQFKLTGESVTVATAGTLVREGYTFASWNTQADGNGATYRADDSYTADQDVTLYAQWAINQYTISFDSAGGSAVAAITQNFGTAVTAPADPTRTGYTFAGWSPVVPTSMPAQDIVLTAQWTVNQYTISFDSVGGSAVAAITQDFGTAVTAPADPTRTGYTFAGWSPVVPTSMPAQDIVLTAQWTVNQYTISFDSAGGSAVAAITQDFGTAVTAPADPTRTGYTFAGWSPVVPTSMPAADVVLTAQWTINQYTISFDSNGGSAVAAITQDFGTSVTAPADPTRIGYTFAGWSPVVPSTMPAADLTVTAQWTINQYTISFDSAGGSAVAAITQDFGTAVTAPADPTRTGYTFAGWSPVVPTSMPAQDIVLTAQWTVNQYTISFDSAGGSAVAAITQDFGTAVTAPADPTREGYTFKGWSPELPATMPANDVNVTAQWQINTFTVTFNVNGGERTGGGELVQIIEFGSDAVAPEISAPEGWAFMGWQGNYVNVRQDETVIALFRFIPVGENLQVETKEDTAVEIVPAISGEDGASLSLVLVSTTQSGTLSNLEGGWTYAPEIGFFGDDAFTYQVSDGELVSPVYRVDITVTPVNKPPVANDDSFTFTRNADGIYLLDVVANDTDRDNDQMTITSAFAEAGSVTIVDNQLRYQALPNFLGAVQLQYVISDGNDHTAQAKVLLEINGSADEDAPMITVPEDKYVDAVALLTRVDLGMATAVDNQGRPVPVSLVDATSMFPPGRSVAYWKAVDYDGRESYAGQQVFVRPLVSFSRDVSTVPGTEVTVSVFLNGDAYSYPVVVPFTVSASNDGVSVLNVPVQELVIESGRSTSFTFTTPLIADGSVETLVFEMDATVNRAANFQTKVEVAERNIAPDVALLVEQNGAVRNILSQAEGLVTITANASDVNVTDVLTYQWHTPFDVSTSAGGEQISFDPAVVPVGVYRIGVSAVDSGVPSLSSTDAIYLSIFATLPNLGDGDRNGNLISDRDDGWGDGNRNGIPDYLDPFISCDVIPEQLFDSGLYATEAEPSACIRKGATAMELLENGIQVFPANGDGVTSVQAVKDTLLANTQAPADAEAINIGGLFDWVLTDVSPNEAIKLVVPQRQPIPPQARYRQYDSQLGWIDFVDSTTDRLWSAAGEPGICPPPGSALWSPGMTAGNHCLQIAISDGGANDLDGEANGMVVNLGGVGVTLQDNTAPIALNDVVSMRWNTELDIDVLANDSDADNDALTVISVTPVVGTAEILADNSIRYTPPANYGGSITMAYSISDGRGGMASATVFVEVLANTAPVAVDDAASTDDRTAITIDVLANDSDADSDVLTITSASAQQGTVTVVNGQSLRYTPKVGFAGTEVVTYLVSDGRGGSASATVSIQIKVVETIVVTGSSSKGSFSAWLLALVVLVGWFSGAARAAEQDWRFSAQLGQAKVRGDDADLIARLPAGAELVSSQWRDTSFAVEIDYRLSPRWSLSVGYSDLGKGTTEIQADTVDPAATHRAAAGIQPMLVRGYTFGLNYDVLRAEDYDVAFGVGLFDWQADMESRMGSSVIRIDDSGSDLFWRLAAAYKLDDNWRVGAAYRYFLLPDQINDFAVTIAYQF